MLAILYALLAASATLCVACSFGRLIAGRRISALGQLGIGAALLATAVFLLLAGGVFRRGSLLALEVSILVLLWWRERRNGLRWPPRAPALNTPRTALAVLGCFAALYLIYALAPDSQPDSAGYHLGLVNEWMRTRLIADRAGFYEMLPHGLEMLMLAAFAFGKHTAATLLHFGFLLATVPLILRVADKLGLARWVGVAASVLYFASPVVGLDGTSAYNDVALAFFSLLVFDLLLECAPAWAAGICAGFCYAIKATGAIAILGGLIWLLLAGRRWKPALIFVASALAMVLPWMVRNQAVAASPVAPFFNDLIPTPYFHAEQEHQLRQKVNELGRVAVAELPIELTLRGSRLQGLLGPAFLLLPLALIGLRERAGRLLLAASALAALAWLTNTGTRFLIPALPFAALALALALERIAPRRAPAIVAVLGAAACLPFVVAAYVPPNAWILRREIPWRAALRLEPPDLYLGRTLWASRAALMIDQHTQPNDLVFDTAGLPYAYVRWIPIGTWQSAAGERLARALEAAHRKAPLQEIVMRWPETACGTLLLRPGRGGAHGEAWTLAEVVPFSATGAPMEPTRDWTAEAWPYPAEAALAMDGNFASQYSTWGPANSETYWEVRLPAAQPLSGVRIVSRDGGAGSPEVWCEDAGGRLRRLSHDYTAAQLPPADLRWSAMRLLRRQGIRWIAMPGRESTWAAVTEDMRAEPGKWGITWVDSITDIHLFHVN